MTKTYLSNPTVALIRKSKLVADDKLRRYLDKLGPHELDALSADALLDRLVDDGLLTPFHVEHLSCGRHQGFVIGNYRILSRIGRGGMGQVFLAEQMGTGHRVAIKVLRKTADNAPLARERFVREALASSKLAHPNIIQVYDANPEADPPYLVMEYVDGISLQAAVAQYGALAADEVAECGRQIALGLQHASDAGLVHRDIKPANILIDRRGIAKILDLGIVRIVTECLTQQLGQSDVILGTVEYIAPEQALSSQVDSRADIYSLGATLYFLLTGRTPFPEGDARTKILQLAQEEPVPLSELVPDLPNDFCAVIHKMMAKDPEDRFQWASEVARALAPWATPRDFPDRFFGRPPSTVESDGAPTAALPAAAFQPVPGTQPHEPIPNDALNDAAAGTIEIGCAQTITATQNLGEITLRSKRSAESPTAKTLDVEDESDSETDDDDYADDDYVYPWYVGVIGTLVVGLLAWGFWELISAR